MLCFKCKLVLKKKKGKKKKNRRRRRKQGPQGQQAHKANKPTDSSLPFLTRAAQDRDSKGALKPIHVH